MSWRRLGSAHGAGKNEGPSGICGLGLKAKPGKKEDNDDELRITVNKKFAAKYQSKKEQEELMQIRQRKQRDGEDSSSESDSSDEEEDENGELFTPSVNVQFLKTIKALRKKDASIYDPKAQFFDEQVEKDSAGETP